MSHDEDPLRPHAHEPNPQPPSFTTAFELSLANGRLHTLDIADLTKMEKTAVSDCYIVSTGHGRSGPFTFAGVTLLALVSAYDSSAWQQVEVVSADGFGNRVMRSELERPSTRPIILAYEINGRLLTREEGAIRLIVPSETDDALRQVKWVSEVRIRP